MKMHHTLVVLFLSCILGVGVCWSLRPCPADAAAPKVTFEWLIKPHLNRATDFGCGVAWVREKRGGTWKQIDQSGKVLIDNYKASQVFPYYDETQLATFIDSKGLTGYINLLGDVVIAPQYQSGVGFKDYRAIVTQKKENISLEGIIDHYGKTIVPIVYESAIVINKNLFAVRKNDKWGYLDGEGNMIADFIFERPPSVEHLSGVFPVNLSGKVGLLNTNGDWVLPASYDNAYPPGEGLIGLEKDGKVGFVDASGETVIDFHFEDAKGGKLRSYYTFSEGLAVSMISEEKGVSGVIDKNGALLFEFQGVSYTPFVKGFLIARQDDVYRLIDRDGNSYLLPPNVEFGITPPAGSLRERILRVRPMDEAKQSVAGGNFGYLKINVE